MSYTEGQVIKLNFADSRREYLDDLYDKYGSFLVFVYTTSGEGATASFFLSKNEKSYQVASYASVSGVNDDWLDMGVDGDGVYVELKGDKTSAVEYHVKVLG